MHLLSKMECPVVPPTDILDNDPLYDVNFIYKRSNGTKIYLSGRKEAQKEEWLIARSITAIVNVTNSVNNKFETTGLSVQHKRKETRYPVDYHRVGIEDSEGLSGALLLTADDFFLLNQATEWIQCRTAESKNVLVHCVSGKNRSVTILIAFMLRFEDPYVDMMDYYYFIGNQARRRLINNTPVMILSHDKGVGTKGSPGAFLKVLREYQKHLRGGKGKKKRKKIGEEEKEDEEMFIF
jgi:protein-tyrosine phosphatase